MTFDEFSEHVEKACSHKLASLLFTALFGLSLWSLGVNVTNIIVSYVTVELLLIGLDRNRREKLAEQIKLDEIIEKTPETDSSKARLEERSEEEIRRIRDG